VTAVRLVSLAVRRLRNLERVDVHFGPRFNVISGDNGHGKTALLEAIYLLMTTKSFRTSSLADLVEHGAGVASVRGLIGEGEDEREQTVGLEGARRHVLLGGKRPASLAAYAIRSPAVVFHPGEMVLSSGPASYRRLLLDRLGLFVDPTYLDHLQRFTVSMRSRQRTLEQRGVGGSELDLFEQLMAEHGTAIAGVRLRAVERIEPELVRAFARITNGTKSVRASYRPGGPLDRSALELALAQSRERDRIRKAVTVGPHRDDLHLTLDGHDARTDASQGEHRAITMALKVAELSCIAAARSAFPILLLDDVSSELDVGRTAQAFELLGEMPGQVFLTTTRPELIQTGGVQGADRLDFAVRSGVVGRETSRS
jgi:DNA replication and repair protein RecF